MNKRSKNLKKNIVFSFILKATSVGLSFLLLPLTVHYLTKIEYGVWMTLFSVMNWVNSLDMGLGLGLRNKLAEAVSKNKLDEIKKYLSTGIFSMVCMGGILLIIFLVGINCIDVQRIYNTTAISEIDLYTSTLFAGIFIILSFILSVINHIYYAYQKAGLTGGIQIIHNLVMLIIIYYLTLQIEHNLIYFVFSFGIAVLLSRISFILYFFAKHMNVIPKWKYIKIEYLKNICNLGIKFFIIQLTCIVLFSSSNILITQCLGPEYVRSYDVVFKIFSIVTMAHSLFLAPLWNAYTDAYIKRDFDWIKKSIRKLLYLMFPIIGSTLILIWKIDFIIKIWLKTTIDIPDYLPFCMGLYVIISCWNNIWAIFLNGIGNINIQLYSSVLSIFIILPLAWYLMKIIGTTGMILAIFICLFFAGIPQMIQVIHLLRRDNK